MFPLGFIVCVIDDQVVIVGFGHVLDAAHKRGIIGIIDIWDDGSDGIGFVCAQAARGAVRDIPQLVDRVQDAPAGLGWDGNTRSIIQYLGNSGLRDTRQAGDIFLSGARGILFDAFPCLFPADTNY